MPLMDKAPLYEEKEQEKDAGKEAASDPSQLFLIKGASPSLGPSPAPSRPQSAAGKRPSISGTMSRDFFRMFKETVQTVNQQIKTEVQVVPAFDAASAPKRRSSGGGRRVSGKTALDEAGQLQAMRAAMEEAERERMKEHEGRMYLDGVLADMQLQLQEAIQGKMDALMRCRCKELEGKAEALAIRVEEVLKAKGVVEEEKKQLWAAVEESERERAEERKQLGDGQGRGRAPPHQGPGEGEDGR